MKRIYKAKEQLNSFSCVSHVAKSVMLFALLCILSSCLQPLNGSFYSKTEEPRIYIQVDKDFSSARTILPDSLTYSSISSFKVTGEDKDGENYTSPPGFRLNDDGTGTISDISQSIWNLILHAYNDSNEEILRGYATADTRHSAVTVDFVLSSAPLKEIEAAKGGLDLKLKYSDANAFETVNQIYFHLDDRLTGEERYSLGTITRGTDADAFTSWISSDGYELDKSTFNYTAGYYNFVVDFYTNNPSHIKIGTYSDIILIEPNRVTAPSLITLKKILYTKPDVPTNVKVWRDDSSMTSEFYNVIITWDDNSDNEEYYSIKVCEYADGSDSVSHSFYIDNKNATSFIEENAKWVDGNLFASSNRYVLKLRTGMLFDFFVASANSVATTGVNGNASYVAREASSSYSSNGKDYTGFAAPGVTSRVNTFAVRYNYGTDAYTFTVDSSENVTYTKAPSANIAYYIYDGSEQSLGNASNYCNGQNKDDVWQKWYIPTSTFVPYQTEISTYREFDNISVTAYYSLSSAGSSELTNLNPSSATVTYNSIDRTGSSSLSIPAQAGENVTISVDTSTSYFEQIEFHIIDDSGFDKIKIINVDETLHKATLSFVLSDLSSSYTIKAAGRKNEISSSLITLAVININ